MVPYHFHMVLYGCIYMVYIYHTSIQIPSVQSSHVQFHTISIWFFMDAHTWYTYTILAFRSPQSKVHMYGSIQFLYGSLQMHVHLCIQCIHTLFIWYLTLLYYRFLHCSPLWGQEICNIFDEHIGKHYHEHPKMEHTSPNDDKLISHMPSLPSLSMTSS